MPATHTAPRKVPVARAPRKDPAERNPRFGKSFDQLINARTDRKYVKVSKNDPQIGVDYYTWLGYQVERLEPGGVRFAGASTCEPGSPLTYRDTVLMSIPLDKWEEIEKWGADGMHGQAKCDRIEQDLLKEDTGAGLEDPFRGLHRLRRQGTRIVNETEPLREETPKGRRSDDAFEAADMEIE